MTKVAKVLPVGFLSSVFQNYMPFGRLFGFSVFKITCLFEEQVESGEFF